MNRKTKIVLSVVAGAALALSTALPASATTISTGTKYCSGSGYLHQKSNAKYSVEHHEISDSSAGEMYVSYNNGASYLNRTTLWNGGTYTFVNDADSTWANGVYLSSSSVTC